MPGSKTNAMKREAVLAAVRAVPALKDFVWDGQDEDDKPASAEALHLAVEAQARRHRYEGAGGHPL
jgi:hypothetical protein